MCCCSLYSIYVVGTLDVLLLSIYVDGHCMCCCSLYMLTVTVCVVALYISIALLVRGERPREMYILRETKRAICISLSVSFFIFPCNLWDVCDMSSHETKRANFLGWLVV